MIQHNELFEAYVAALREVKQLSEAWWDELLGELPKLSNDPQKAEKILRERWPFGPTSHPWVIAVFRDYYLRCEALNDEIEAQKIESAITPVREEDWSTDDEPSQTTIPPRVLVIEQLASDETEDLYDFILNLRFMPIGQKGQEIC